MTPGMHTIKQIGPVVALVVVCGTGLAATSPTAMAVMQRRSVWKFIVKEMRLWWGCSLVVELTLQRE